MLFQEIREFWEKKSVAAGHYSGYYRYMYRYSSTSSATTAAGTFSRSGRCIEKRKSSPPLIDASLFKGFDDAILMAVSSEESPAALRDDDDDPPPLPPFDVDISPIQHVIKRKKEEDYCNHHGGTCNNNKPDICIQGWSDLDTNTSMEEKKKVLAPLPVRNDCRRDKNKMKTKYSAYRRYNALCMKNTPSNVSSSIDAGDNHPEIGIVSLSSIMEDMSENRNFNKVPGSSKSMPTKCMENGKPNALGERPPTFNQQRQRHQRSTL